MNKDELLRKLRNKFDVDTNNQLAKYLGITSSALSQYSDDLSPENVARLIEKAWDRGEELGLEYGIFPIVEFFPINHSKSKQGKKWELLPSSSESSERDNLLRIKEVGSAISSSQSIGNS